MSAAIARLLAIDDRIDALWQIKHDAITEADDLRRERSSILMGISWSERLEYDRAQAASAVKALMQASAVGARREE